MKLSCLLGRHWPVAAFAPARDGPETSRCVDCGIKMTKQRVSDWRAAEPAMAARFTSLIGLDARASSGRRRAAR